MRDTGFTQIKPLLLYMEGYLPFIKHGLLRKHMYITQVNEACEDEGQCRWVPNILNVLEFHIKITAFNLKIKYIK